jgi:hypothetical protein
LRENEQKRPLLVENIASPESFFEQFAESKPMLADNKFEK